MINDIKQSRTVRNSVGQILIGLGGLSALLYENIPLLKGSISAGMYGYIAFVLAICNGIYTWRLRRDTTGPIGGQDANKDKTDSPGGTS